MIATRKLPGSRWNELKELRLESLRNDPTAFGSSFGEDARLTAEAWRRRVRNTIFALADGAPVGMISCVFNSRPKTKHVADIYGVYVRPMHRRQGVAKRLLDAALSEARGRKGVVKLRLTVNPVHTPAVRLYEGAGFVVVGRAKKELKVGRKYFDLLHMEKLL